MKEIPIKIKFKNQLIFGVLHRPKNKNPPLLLMVHGFTGDRLGNPHGLFVKTAKIFCKKGYAVLRFDFRGSGDSADWFEHQNIDTELEDLKRVLNYIEKLNGINKNKIGLIGHSRGGFVSVISASKDKRIKCLVAWSPAVFMKKLWGKKWVKNIRKNGHVYDIYGFKLTKQLVNRDFEFDNIINQVKNVKAPLLILHGNKDRSVPLYHSRELYRNANKPKKIIIIEGAYHGFFDDKNMKKLSKLTVEWFDKWLK